MSERAKYSVTVVSHENRLAELGYAASSSGGSMKYTNGVSSHTTFPEGTKTVSISGVRSHDEFWGRVIALRKMLRQNNT